MNALEQFKDEISMTIFGRSATLAKAGKQCVSCYSSTTKHPVPQRLQI